MTLPVRHWPYLTSETPGIGGRLKCEPEDFVVEEIPAFVRDTHGGMALDFSGSAPVHIGNLNATPAIVRSVVIYVLRLLISEPLPLISPLSK